MYLLRNAFEIFDPLEGSPPDVEHRHDFSNAVAIARPILGAKSKGQIENALPELETAIQKGFMALIGQECNQKPFFISPSLSLIRYFEISKSNSIQSNSIDEFELLAILALALLGLAANGPGPESLNLPTFYGELAADAVDAARLAEAREQASSIHRDYAQSAVRRAKPGALARHEPEKRLRAWCWDAFSEKYLAAYLAEDLTLERVSECLAKEAEADGRNERPKGGPILKDPAERFARWLGEELRKRGLSRADRRRKRSR